MGFPQKARLQGGAREGSEWKWGRAGGREGLVEYGREIPPGEQKGQDPLEWAPEWPKLSPGRVGLPWWGPEQGRLM